MTWIMTILIALWGLPLLTILAVGLACLVSQRLRRSVARILGLVIDPVSSPPARSAAGSARRKSRADERGGRSAPN